MLRTGCSTSFKSGSAIYSMSLTRNGLGPRTTDWQEDGTLFVPATSFAFKKLLS